MGNGDGSSRRVGNTLQCVLHNTLRVRVESGSSFVENENRWLADQCSGKNDTLLLTSGELASGCTDSSCEPVVEALDESQCVRVLSGSHDKSVNLLNFWR